MKQQRANLSKSGRISRIRGRVTEVDLELGRVKIEVRDLGIISPWLNVLVPNNTRNKLWWMPDIGDFGVGLLDEEGQTGEWLGAFYNRADMPPVTDQDKYHLAFNDGTTLEYDRAASRLLIDIADGELAIEVRGAGAAKFLVKGGELKVECDRKITIAAKEELELVSDKKVITTERPIPPYFYSRSDEYFSDE